MNIWECIKGREKITRRYLFLLGGMTVAFILFTFWSVGYTSNSNFCGTCHEMSEGHQTWITSSHKNIACVECHAEPGLQGTVKAKAKGLKELYLHITGSYATPKADAKDINCYSCHQDKVKTNTEMAAMKKDPHTWKHFDNGMNCISCHGGLVHNQQINNITPNRDNCTTCHLDQMKK